MTWVHYCLIAAVVGLGIVWPISFFGYQFYAQLTKVDEAGKH